MLREFSCLRLSVNATLILLVKSWSTFESPRLSGLILPPILALVTLGGLNLKHSHTCRPLDPSTPRLLRPPQQIQPLTGYSLSERSISPSSRLCPIGTRLAPFAESRPPPKTSRSTPWLSGPHHLQVARNLEPAHTHSSAAGQRHWCWGYPSARRRRLPVETKETKQ